MSYTITYKSSNNDNYLAINKNLPNIKITYRLYNEEDELGLYLINTMINWHVKNITIDDIVLAYENVYMFTIKLKNNVKYEYGFISSDKMNDVDDIVVYSKEKEAEDYLKLAKSVYLVMNKIVNL